MMARRQRFDENPRIQSRYVGVVTQIEVAPTREHAFRVTVTEGASSTSHEVTVSPEELELIDNGDPVDLVTASFRFLLERESKESIFSSFDLSIIARYFPEYPTEIREYL
jgi:hypothetical protein